jgi:hypothetical protein
MNLETLKQNHSAIKVIQEVYSIFQTDISFII